MYSRSYYTEEEKLIPPVNYDGNAFSAEENQVQPEAQEVGADIGVAKRENVSSPIFTLPFLSGIFGDGAPSFLSKIGTEEILIIAAAAFLLFNKNGDKECAIILLILLFIN